MEIFSLVLSAIALTLSLWQFFNKREREKKESTLNAFASLQKSIFDNQLISNDRVKKVEEKIKEKNFDANIDEDFASITQALAKIEHFSVGINTNVYSIKILNRLAGNFIIDSYSKLIPIIKFKRYIGGHGKFYDEFEKMANKLKKIRKIK